MIEAAILLGGFVAACIVWVIIDKMHQRWAWRSAAREIAARNALFPSSNPREPPPKRDSPTHLGQGKVTIR